MPGATHRQITQAAVPVSEEPVPAKKVIDCPNCHSARNVRKLVGKSFFCTTCLLEFDHKKVYALSDYKKAPEKKEKPKYERRYRAGKRINKDWVVSKVEKVVARFLELQETMPALRAAGKVAEEIDRDPDDILYLIIDLAGTDWEIILEEKPKKKFPAGLREEFGGG